MKKKFIVVTMSAFGALATAGLISATPAMADCATGDPPPPDGPAATPPLTPARVACVTNEQLSEFARTTSPQYNLDVLINGTKDNPELGLVNQPGEFVRSVGDFFNGPRSPDPAPESANGF